MPTGKREGRQEETAHRTHTHTNSTHRTHTQTQRIEYIHKLNASNTNTNIHKLKASNTYTNSTHRTHSQTQCIEHTHKLKHISLSTFSESLGNTVKLDTWMFVTPKHESKKQGQIHSYRNRVWVGRGSNDKRLTQAFGQELWSKRRPKTWKTP